MLPCSKTIAFPLHPPLFFVITAPEVLTCKLKVVISFNLLMKLYDTVGMYYNFAFFFSFLDDLYGFWR